MPYQFAGIDVHMKMLTVVVATSRSRATTSLNAGRGASRLNTDSGVNQPTKSIAPLDDSAAPLGRSQMRGQGWRHRRKFPNKIKTRRDGRVVDGAGLENGSDRL
jgi:hypothetical protein